MTAKTMRQHNYYVYIASNRERTIYIGVTNNLRRRISEHKNGEIPGFSKRHDCSILVYFQYFRDIRSAIAREKQLKGWRRQKKVELIELTNKYWKELEID
jgi:putative endonuclease